MSKKNSRDPIEALIEEAWADFIRWQKRNWHVLFGMNQSEQFAYYQVWEGRWKETQ